MADASLDPVQSVRQLLDLCHCPCTDNRLRAVIAAHPPFHSTLTKSRRLTIVNKIKHRLSDNGGGSDSASDIDGNDRLSAVIEGFDENESDRILTIVAYILDTTPTHTHTAAITSTPLSHTSVRSSGYTSRAASALSVRNINGAINDAASDGVSVTAMSAPTSPQPALSAPSTLPSSMLNSSTLSSRTMATPSRASIHSHSITSTPAPSLPLASSHSQSQTISTGYSHSIHSHSYANNSHVSVPSTPIATTRHTNSHTNTHTIAATPMTVTKPVSDNHHQSASLRVHSDEDAIDLCYGDTVTLKSLSSHHFLSLDHDPLAHSQSPSPSPSMSLHGQSLTPYIFVFYNAKNLNDRSPVRYLDSVMIGTNTQPHVFLLSSHRSNDIQASTMTALTSPQLNATKFTVYAGRPVRDEAQSQAQSLAFLSVRGIVKNGDDIVLKSSSGLYVSVSATTLTLIERVSSDSEILIVNRAHLPVLSDELKKLAELPAPLPLSAALSLTLTNNDTSANTTSDSVDESLLVDDVLTCLLGLNGDYLFAVTSLAGVAEYKFLNDRNVDVSHRAIVHDRLLPLCNHYLVISHYLNTHRRHEFGLVHHSLTQAVQRIVDDYHSLVTQLDYHRDSLTLLKLSYQLTTVRQTLSYLASLIVTVTPLIGGAVLNAVHSALTQAGESNHRALLVHLCKVASQPFLLMLSQWLHTGSFIDRYHEFCVTVNEDIQSSQLQSDFNAMYWSLRWITRSDRCPSFLLAHLDLIATTGKYWNVIRQCSSRSVATTVMPVIAYSENASVYSSIIDDAYTKASHSLLSLLLDDYHLITHLSVIKKIYLLGVGDWLVHFMDAAHSELIKPAYSINKSKLQSLLDLSIKLSAATATINDTNTETDGGKDRESPTLSVALQSHRLDAKLNAIHSASDIHSIHCVNLTIDDTDGDTDANADSGSEILSRSLTGLDSMTLQYRVHYPLSLILSKTQLTKYQLIFRLLFQLKFYERELNAIFLVQKWHRSAKTSNLQLGNANHLLRSKLSHFIQSLLYYFTAEIIEKQFARLIEQIKHAKNFDSVLSDHSAFVDTILKSLLLTDLELLNPFLKIIHLIQSYLILINKETQHHQLTGSQCQHLDEDFNYLIQMFVRVLQSKNRSLASSLIQRLDYNGYYQQIV